MKVIAVSIGQPITLDYEGRQVRTGIFKQPVDGRVQIGLCGLAGDGQADLEAHGGKDKAIYVYSVENYRYWEQQLQRGTLSYGQFGENLTVEGMLDESVHIGDVFSIGTSVVQVTQPRVPCYKLGIRMEAGHFPKEFMFSGKVGFYLRVLQAGDVGAGDAIECLGRDPVGLNVRESMLALSNQAERFEIIAKALQIDALSSAWRSDLAQRQAGSKAAH